MYMDDDEFVEYIFSMQQTCTLDMSEGESTLQEVADIYGLTRERVRQIAYWRTMHKGALVNLLKGREFRLLLKGYYGSEVKG